MVLECIKYFKSKAIVRIHEPIGRNSFDKLRDEEIRYSRKYKKSLPKINENEIENYEKSESNVFAEKIEIPKVGTVVLLSDYNDSDSKKYRNEPHSTRGPYLLEGTDDKVRIQIIAPQEFPLNYKDMSVYVPKKGAIEKTAKYIPIYFIQKFKPSPMEITFRQICHRTIPYNSSNEFLRSFDAVKVDNLYMLWIEERNEWIGIEFKVYHAWEGNVPEEYIQDASGPYRLDEDYINLIRNVYDRRDLTIEETSHTPLKKLKKTSATSKK